MRKLTIAALALCGFGTSVGAQPPPGITPEMIATVVPLEGAPHAVPGRYGVLEEDPFGSTGYVLHPNPNWDVAAKRLTN